MNTASINRGDDSLSTHPYLALSAEQQEQLQTLGKAMKKMYNENGYVMVRNVRQFGKVVEDQKKWVEKINTEDETLTACAGTIATVIASEDAKKGKNTVDALQQAQTASPYTRSMASISVSPAEGEKFWTAGLNAPIAVLHQLATENDIPLDAIIVANQTHDVEIDSDALTQIAEILKRGELPTTVRVTPGVVLKSSKNSESGISKEEILKKKGVIIDAIVRYVEAMKSGESIDFLSDDEREILEIIITLDRNTLGFWKLSDLIAMNGFHPATNACFGMEDTRALMSQLIAIYNTSGISAVRNRLDRAFSKDIIVQYGDARMAEACAENASKKLIVDQTRKSHREVYSVLHQSRPSDPHSVNNEPVVRADEMDFRFD